VSKVEVLLEEIRGNVKLSLEGHDVLRNEMHQMESRLTEKIQENSSAIKFVANKVNVIEKSVTNIDVRVTNIDKKLDQHIFQHA